MTAQGWYIEAEGMTTERWWNGRRWTGQVRRAYPDTPVFSDEPTPGPDPHEPDGLRSASMALYVLAALVGLAAVIGGIMLLVHSVPLCTANPYNDAFGTDLQDCTNRHPFVGAGATVLIGGAIQAAVVAVVAYLCGAVATLRSASERHVEDDPPAPSPDR